MKRILISIFMLFMLASCNVFKAPFDIDINSIDVTIDEQVEVKVVVSVKDEKKTNIKENEFGFIYEINSNNRTLKDFTLDGELTSVAVLLNDDLSFSYQFEDLDVIDYVLPIGVRSYCKTKDGKVYYSKSVKTFNVYQIALKHQSSYACGIVNSVESATLEEDLSLTFSVDGDVRGYQVQAQYGGSFGTNTFGIIYKKDPTSKEKENLNFDSLGYKIEILNQPDYITSFKDIKKEEYLKEVTFRVFMYNHENKTFAIMKTPVTTSLFEIALNDDSDFGKEVKRYVGNIKVIDDFFINTDVDEEYQVGSHSESIEVEMYFDYLIVRLTITARDGYKFNPKIDKENIVIMRVDDDIRVTEYEMEVTPYRIIIEYEDYGWGPPM